jgi:hypothetical protein
MLLVFGPWFIIFQDKQAFICSNGFDFDLLPIGCFVVEVENTTLDGTSTIEDRLFIPIDAILLALCLSLLVEWLATR